MPPARRGLQAAEATVTAAGGMVRVPPWGSGERQGWERFAGGWLRSSSDRRSGWRRARRRVNVDGVLPV